MHLQPPTSHIRILLLTTARGASRSQSSGGPFPFKYISRELEKQRSRRPILSRSTSTFRMDSVPNSTTLSVSAAGELTSRFFIPHHQKFDVSLQLIFSWITITRCFGQVVEPSLSFSARQVLHLLLHLRLRSFLSLKLLFGLPESSDAR